MKPTKQRLVWLLTLVMVAVPIGAAMFSPLLQWRSPIYIGAGFAGIVAMACLVFQPLLISGALTPLASTARRMHRWLGLILVTAIVLHVIGLWITSPPDVIDALLFVSPTPFSLWGVIAMWSVFVTALLALGRRRVAIRARVWRLSHKMLALITVSGTVLHAVQIDGTMETWSKYGLCVVLVGVTAWVLFGSKHHLLK